TLFVTAAFVLCPLVLQLTALQKIDAEMGTASWAAFLSPVFDFVAPFLPGFLRTWVHTYAAYPGFFVALGVPVALLTMRGTSLAARTADGMRPRWTAASSRWQHQGLPTGWIYEMRSQGWYRDLIGATKRHVIPFVLLVVLVYVGGVAISRGLFAVGNSL